MNLVERLLDWKRREPQRVWLCQPIDEVERRYTFAQAADLQRLNRTAHWLGERLGRTLPVMVSRAGDFPAR